MSKEGEVVPAVTPVKEPTPIDTPELKEEIRREVLKEENVEKFIPLKGELITDKDSGRDFITITISRKILHYIQEGLVKYRDQLAGNENVEVADRERKETTEVINEMAEVKAILNDEVIVKTIGLQEPNPKTDVGIPNDPT